MRIAISVAAGVVTSVGHPSIVANVYESRMGASYVLAMGPPHLAACQPFAGTQLPGKSDGESCCAGDAVYSDGAVMRADDRGRDGEPKAGTARAA